MEIIIIAAVSENRVIGKDGKIPWHSKEELTYFKETTLGFPVIMGRKTYESIGKTLQGRFNLVLSRKKDYYLNITDIRVFHNLKDAVDFCNYGIKAEKVFVIGGEEVFTKAIDVAEKISISKMKISVDGDTYFPELDMKKWCEESRKDYNDFELFLFKRCKNKEYAKN